MHRFHKNLRDIRGLSLLKPDGKSGGGMSILSLPPGRADITALMENELQAVEIGERNAKKICERKIRYWECRPMPAHPSVVVCPSDSCAIVGSMTEPSGILIKEKLFDFSELLSTDRGKWLRTFVDGDFAVFRLTPEQYHYVHVPASGRVEDVYEIEDPCQPYHLRTRVSLLTPFSKNRRIITIVQTDAPGGAGIGAVAIIEVVALLGGRIEQCYSTREYLSPQPVAPGMFLKRGQPKSLFCPDSSAVILLFQKNRVKFVADLILNRFRLGVASRYSLGFKQPIVETEVPVRSPLAIGIKSKVEMSNKTPVAGSFNRTQQTFNPRFNRS
jgi:phosphatidylserine decarboxylase